MKKQLTFVIALLFMAAGAWGQNTPNEHLFEERSEIILKTYGFSKSEFSGSGEGTEADPYIIN